MRAFVLVIVSLSAGCVGSPPASDTTSAILLMGVARVELNNVGDPVYEPSIANVISFRMIHRESGRAITLSSSRNTGHIRMAVKPGTYCFYDFYITGIQTIPLSSAICLVLQAGVVNNAGFWTIGWYRDD